MATNIDPVTLTATNAFMERIGGKYSVEGAILFGSRARRTHADDSDADVAVLLRDHNEVDMTTRLAMADIAFDVLMDTGVLVAAIPIWMDEWDHPENHSNPQLLDNIKREGIRL